MDKALQALQQLDVRGEVVVADNGSSDGSQEIAREHGARVIDVARQGYGHALRAGIQAARGRYIVMGDSDDTYDFTALERFVEQLRAGYDLVMGNRFRGGILPGAMPWLHRHVGNPVLTGILNLFFRTPIGDAHCGLWAFRKDSYAKLGLASPGTKRIEHMIGSYGRAPLGDEVDHGEGECWGWRRRKELGSFPERQVDFDDLTRPIDQVRQAGMKVESRIRSGGRRKSARDSGVPRRDPP